MPPTHFSQSSKPTSALPFVRRTSRRSPCHADSGNTSRYRFVSLITLPSADLLVSSGAIRRPAAALLRLSGPRHNGTLISLPNGPKPAKLAINPILQGSARQACRGMIASPDGAPYVARRSCGRGVGLYINRTGVGRRHRAQTRFYYLALGPISRGSSSHISHEAIYQALYVQGRGALRRELRPACAPRQALRMPRGAHARARQDLHLSRNHDQSTSGGGSRSSRAGPLGRGSHAGIGSSAIGTLVERTTRHLAAAPATHDEPWPRKLA